ncbi:hypothetical protein [Spartinivicinus poritis]|uniref:Uncharacterized protein n=1 Tax=Spartinivicinus poritis TaxID=2994640 RepID=A0ABT5UAC9_9GAMM|nr:hypothetical protein [Spartinivicinus sp. A2-2]MDE1462418.1 hypothetical protein [Spartinivicinus sp. A2-2]
MKIPKQNKHWLKVCQKALSAAELLDEMVADRIMEYVNDNMHLFNK